MKKCEDGKYQYSKFSNEDVQMYRGILEELPYDPALENFFLKEGQEARRQKNIQVRHTSNVSFEMLEEVLSCPSAETVYMEQVRNEELYTLLSNLTKKQMKCIIQSFFHDQSCAEIGRSEGVSRIAVWQAVQRAFAAMRKRL